MLDSRRGVWRRVCTAPRAHAHAAWLAMASKPARDVWPPTARTPSQTHVLTPALRRELILRGRYVRPRALDAILIVVLCVIIANDDAGIVRALGLCSQAGIGLLGVALCNRGSNGGLTLYLLGIKRRQLGLPRRQLHLALC